MLQLYYRLEFLFNIISHHYNIYIYIYIYIKITNMLNCSPISISYDVINAGDCSSLCSIS